MKRKALALSLFFLAVVSSFFLAAVSSAAHDRKFRADWDVSMYGTVSTSNVSPFWAVTGRNGIFPTSDGGLMTAAADVVYGLPLDFNLVSGFSLAASAVPGDWKPMVDRLYLGMGWKNLKLDLGMRNRPAEFENLSVSGGNIIWSGNSRNVPGINLYSDYIHVDRKRIFAFRFSFGNYQMIDNRYVERPLLMERSLDVKFALGSRVDLKMGIGMWSQWAGVSPKYGQQPHDFMDFIRVALGMSGGSDATESDQINALGNHLGREVIRVDWKADDFTMSFQHDIPFDDGSGMGFQNFPDGINTVLFSFNRKNRWVSDILYEFVFTKSQSGALHDRPAKDEEKPDLENGHVVLGGNDNYFNNGEYKTAWTYYGRTIGIPLFTPAKPGEDGVVYGVVNNRVVAHHFGMKGMVARKIPYRFLFTYSRNFGCYYQREDRFKSVPEQFSVALEGELPRVHNHFPVAVGLGLYADWGRLLPESYGMTLRLSYAGSCKSKR